MNSKTVLLPIVRGIRVLCDVCEAQLTQAAAAPLPRPAAEAVTIEIWNLYLISFCLYAECYGDDGKPITFAQNRMARFGVCGRQAWDEYTRVLMDAGILVKLPRSGTGWAVRPNGAPWHRHALRHALKTGRLDVTPHLKRDLSRPTRPIVPPPSLGQPRFIPTQISQHRPAALVRAAKRALRGTAGTEVSQ